MKIGISGFPPETTEEEIRRPLEEFGAVVKSVTIEPSNIRERNVAIVDADTDETGAKVLVKKLDGFYWKGRKLHAYFYRFFR